MGMLLNILSDNEFARIDSKRFMNASSGIHKLADESVENYALYKYALQRAQRYPKKWIDNHLGAKVLLNIRIQSNDVSLTSLNILAKSDLLGDDEVLSEVEKTISLARGSFPVLRKSPVEVSLVLNWIG